MFPETKLHSNELRIWRWGHCSNISFLEQAAVFSQEGCCAVYAVWLQLSVFTLGILDAFFVAIVYIIWNNSIFTDCQRSCREAMFSVMCVCLSVHRGGVSYMTINQDALDLTLQVPICKGPWLPCKWHLVAITGDLFKLVHLRTSLYTPPAADIWWMPTEAHTAGKRAVRILLEYFLVCGCNFILTLAK